MKMIYLRIGTSEDVVRICGDKVFEAIKPMKYKNFLVGYTKGQPDKEIFLAGVAGNMPGAGEVWISLNDGNHIYLPQAMRNAIEFALSRWGYYRLQASAVGDHKKAIKLIEHLGFSREGILRKAGPGKQDVYLYAKVQEG